MRSISSRTAGLAASAVALVVVLGACSEADERGEGLDVVTKDESREVEVGGDLALPDVGGTEDGGTVVATDEDQADDSTVEDNTPDTSDASSVPDEGESDSVPTNDAPASAAPSDDGTGGTPSSGTPSDDGTGGTPSSGTPSGDGTDGTPAGDGPVEPPAEADAASDPATAGRVNVAYPASSVTDLTSGSQVDLAAELSDREKRTLLWFWQPGATPSAAEADVVRRLTLERGDNVDVIAIGTGGDLTAAQQFLAETGLPATKILWDSGADAAEHYSVDSLPASVLLDRNGDIIARWPTLSPEVFEFLAILP